MGKRLIIKGADFSNVAASVEPILNPLTVISVGQGGTWNSSYMDNAPVGSYSFLTNTGNLRIRTVTGEENTTMPEGYNSLNYYGAILVKREGESRYDVAYPDEFELITGWSDGTLYNYNESQSTEPQKSSNGGFRCSQVHLNEGDVLIANVIGGDGARAIWVMKPNYSSTIKVASSGSRGDYAPICYEATEDCAVFINSSNMTYKSYILRK